MCGFVVAYHFDPSRPVDRRRFVLMNDSLTHRGPDDHGIFVGRGMALGHRRLSIIDIDGGHQPMWDVERRIAVVFNGEIYNHRELRETLKRAGHHFETSSDTEVIVHAYREWGSGCLAHLAGMFAFCIFDKRNRTLFLARDRLGEKPLYYYRDGSRIVFASELKAFAEDPSIPRIMHPEAVADYFSYHFVPGPKTIYQNIFKVQPGHAMYVDGDKVIEEPYWDVDFSEPQSSMRLTTAIEQLDAALSNSVREKLRSDVPLGAFLSGGLDSSLILGLMAESSQDVVKTFTMGFDEAAYDERAYAKETADFFKTEHHDQRLTPSATDIFDKLVWHYDEPFGDASAIPTYYLSQFTRRNVVVALSGDGGDEVFAGYRRYVFARLEDKIRDHIPSTLRHRLLRPSARLYPKADYLPRFLRAKSTLANLSETPERAYFRSLTQAQPGSLLSSDFRSGLSSYDPFSVMERHFAASRTKDPLARLQYVDLKMYLPDDILVKVDRASMAHSLEVRVPILDHRVVELGARIPSDLKLNGSETKIVLRALAASRLPESVLRREKRGFVVPLPEWFRNGPLKELAYATLFDRPGGHSGVLDTNRLRRLWRDHQLGLRNNGRALWTTLMFEGWAKRYLPTTGLYEQSSLDESPESREQLPG
jgi:asparagine synthase (glutamine-hydrolysing)